MNTHVHVTVMPTIEDTRVSCHERDAAKYGTPTTIVAIRCGAATVQFHTREDAIAWVAHLSGIVTAAVAEADEREAVAS